VKLKRLVASLSVASAAMVGSPAAHAGIPVFDGANLANAIQQLMSWSDQYTQMTDQFNKLQEQLAEAKAIKGRLEGIKSLGSILNDPDIKGLLPEEMKDAAKLLATGTHSSGRITTIKGILDTYGVKTTIDGRVVENGFDAADRLEKLKAMGDSSNKRVAQINSLGAKLDASADAKESMDLVGRNALEIAQAQTQATAQMASIEAAKAQEELRRRAAYTKRLDSAVTAIGGW